MTSYDNLEIVYLNPLEIQIMNRKLDLCDETVEELITCIQAEGFRTPIEVYTENILYEKTWILATGHNRLTAAMKLGINLVPCIVIAPEAARLRELNENFARRNLTVIEHADLLIALVAETKQHAAQNAQHHKTQAGQQPGGRSETARRLKIPRDTIARAEQISSLNPEARTVARESGLERNQNALLRAAKERGERQAQCLLVYPAKLSVSQALPALPAEPAAPNVTSEPLTPRDLWFSKINRLWDEAQGEWRKAFLQVVAPNTGSSGIEEILETGFTDSNKNGFFEDHLPIVSAENGDNAD